MKNLKTILKSYLYILFLGLLLILQGGCDDSDEFIEIVPPSTVTLNELITKLDFDSDIAFVRNGESIQDAIDASISGEIIYIGPGTYNESLNFNKSDIKLIGLSIDLNDLTIKNNKDENIEILKLYDNKSVDHFIKKRANSRNIIIDFSRTELGAGIAHYQFKVRMGDGEFDIIRIHRVVRESQMYHPVPTKGDVFMVHGALAGFNATFLSPGLETNDINAKTSAPFYLASKNIDVWGIDLGWTMVPVETTNFSFFDEWGFEKDAKHTLKAMRIARCIRGFTGQGFSALNILGFSSGNTVAYAAANRETQKRNIMKRHIKGLITVDDAFKFGFDAGCDDANKYLTAISSGTLQNEFGAFFNKIGGYALSAPTDPAEHPAFAGSGLSNSQASRVLVSAPAAPEFGVFFHFFGGDVGTFNDLFYSDDKQVFKLQTSYSPYMPTQIWFEYNAVNCSTYNVTFDDHLNEISVPIFYVGTGGGTGSAGYYTATLTDSEDVTNHLVSLNEPIFDFGHVDTWLAQDADKLVWSELRNWIGNHQ